MAVLDHVAGQEAILSRAEERRLRASLAIDQEGRSDLGQYFTPAPVAALMASMVVPVLGDSVRILDPGAGSGSLTSTLVNTICTWPSPPAQIEVTMVEVDPRLEPSLLETVADCEVLCAEQGITFSGTVKIDDFLKSAAFALSSGEQPAADIAILNPPYRKIGTNSTERAWARACGVEVSNLYAAFVASSVASLAPGGQMVAITPRSFTNGTYFRRFRRFLLDRTTIAKLHVFDSRDQTFRGDGVLQENLIMHAGRGPSNGQHEVVISASHRPGEPIRSRTVKGSAVVRADDPEAFIRLPVDDDQADVASRMASLPAKLDDLGLTVSTGPVVDFRLREHLRATIEPSGTVPLLYPATVRGSQVSWPPVDSRKPCAISCEEATDKWLLPDGDYVLVRRFSAKEERRRVVAGVLEQDQLGYERIGLENHLNYFHCDGQGIGERSVAIGLTAYLNSAFVDTYIRLFNGHTQINATDLRALRYPSAPQLQRLAQSAGSESEVERHIEDFSAESAQS